MKLSEPEPIAARHAVDLFDSGDPALDSWLKRRALPNQLTGASRTYVVRDRSRIVAYYAVASGSVAVGLAPGRFRRNMPDPIPVAFLARLAVDLGYQGRGLGRALVRDCVTRVVRAAGTIGIRGIAVHAISERARSFYEALGFAPSPADPLMLMVTLADARIALSLPPD